MKITPRLHAVLVLIAVTGAFAPFMAGADMRSITDAAAPTCERAGRTDSDTLIVVLVDVSGSVATRMPLAEVVNDLAGLLDSMPPGYRFHLRYINSNSFADQKSAYTAVVPPVGPAPKKPQNRYNRPAARQYQQEIAKQEASQECADIAKERIKRDLRALPQTASPAAKTDIHGALAAADAIISGCSGLPIRRKLVVIYTDLDDTVHRSRPALFPGFRDADVLVRTRFAATSPERATGLQRDFLALMEQSGPRRVEFVPLRDVPGPVAVRIFTRSKPVIQP